MQDTRHVFHSPYVVNVEIPFVVVPEEEESTASEWKGE